MPGKKFETPVLLIIFNRPELTRQLIARLKEIKPTRVFVAADAPRPGVAGEAERCRQARQMVKEITWGAKVETLFQKKNLGCKYGPYAAIDWFFNRVNEGIILEDDNLPDRSFFYFCQELLERYRDDARIASISGNNFQFGRRRSSDSYYFSRFSHTSGWASWRRAWQLFDLKIKRWPILKKGGWLRDVLADSAAVRYWTVIFDGVYSGVINTAWDYQWTFMCWTNRMLSILPNQNLITNTGFGVEGATHTRSKNKFADMKVKPLKFPLKHPAMMIENRQADDYTQRNNYVLWKELGVRALKKLGLR